MTVTEKTPSKYSTASGFEGPERNSLESYTWRFCCLTMQNHVPNVNKHLQISICCESHLLKETLRKILMDM